MKRNAWLVIGVVVLVIAAASVALIHNNSKSKPTDTASMNISQKSHTAPKTEPVATSTVAIDNFAFAPQAITVKVGTTVTWTNKDSAAHTVTADTPSSDAPNSGNIQQNQTYSFTFKKAGTYAYHCAVHPDMLGTVTVTE